MDERHTRQQIRLAGMRVRGGALVVDEHPAHLADVVTQHDIELLRHPIPDGGALSAKIR